MKRKPTVSVCTALFSLLFIQNALSSPLVMTLPNMNWALEIEAAGFDVQSLDTAPSGEEMHLAAENKKTGVFMTVFLEKAKTQGDQKVCREYYWSNAKKNPFEKSDIKRTEEGDMAISSYLVKEFRGQELNQKNINAYLSESGYWVDVHLSKVSYAPKDDQLFNDVLKGVAINKNYEPTSIMSFNFGNLYYRQKNYNAAIPHYERSVMLEEQNPTMEKRMWIILIDQLGMAYGISGDLEKAKKLYESAIKKEPTTPMFYYSYACAFAESNDQEQTINNLKLAYKYKANMLDGEEFPDPMTDSSFTKFLTDENFINAIQEMEKQVATNDPASPNIIYYRGKDVFDDASGVSVITQTKDLVSFSNSELHYLLMLPYSKEWEFDISEKYHLKGHSHLLNISLQVLLDTDVSPAEGLRLLQEELMAKDSAPSKFEYVKHLEETVLRTEVDCGKIDKVFEGVKQIHFYAIKKCGKTAYTYHFSKMISRDGSDPLSDKKILDFLTAGFFLNFER